MAETNTEAAEAYGVLAHGSVNGDARILLCDTAEIAADAAERFRTHRVVRRGGCWHNDDGTAVLAEISCVRPPIFPFYHGDGGVSRTIFRPKPPKAEKAKPAAKGGAK